MNNLIKLLSASLLTLSIFSFNSFAASFVVNTTSDTDDAICDVAHCSLREAIHAANASLNGANPDEITFSINALNLANDCRNVEGATVCRINVVGKTGFQNSNGEDVYGMPIVTEAVKIDGTIQENRSDIKGYPNITRPSIEISGVSTPIPSTGFFLLSNGSTLQGLILHGFKTSPLNEFGGEGVAISFNASGNTVRANYIAADASGRATLPLEHQGVLLLDASENIVGGENLSDRNVFLGVGFRAVDVGSAGIFGVGSNKDIVQNNFIGMGVAGEEVGSPDDGLFAGPLFPGAPIPQDTLFKENIIIKPADVGIFIGNADNLQIIKNQIKSGTVGILINGGTKPQVLDNTVMETRNNAVRFRNTTGGMVKNNVIKKSLINGILVNSTAKNIAILNNSIFDNQSLGIDLSTSATLPNGVTPNDALDADGAANGLQNYPVLDEAMSFLNPSLVQVYGSLDSKPNTQYLIQAFSSECGKQDPSGYGEGQVFVGEKVVQTDVSGHVDFHFPANANPAVGSILTSTATDLATNDTSEFSHWVNIKAVGNARHLACP